MSSNLASGPFAGESSRLPFSRCLSAMLASIGRDDLESETLRPNFGWISLERNFLPCLTSSGYEGTVPFTLFMLGSTL